MHHGERRVHRDLSIHCMYDLYGRVQKKVQNLSLFGQMNLSF